jgi:hypothetical protein
VLWLGLEIFGTSIVEMLTRCKGNLCPNTAKQESRGLGAPLAHF